MSARIAERRAQIGFLVPAEYVERAEAIRDAILPDYVTRDMAQVWRVIVAAGLDAMEKRCKPRRRRRRG